MELNQEEVNSLFNIAKYPCDSAKIDFPMQGEYIEVELQNETGRIKFQSDINRANKIVNKITFQLRHKKMYAIRRLDLNGNHKNPPAPVPDEIFDGYEDYIFDRQDHVHFYIEGYNERWALPLSKLTEIDILETDDIYEKMSKFFKYCNVENLEFKITKNLLL
jgi:hypothetical protein